MTEPAVPESAFRALLRRLWSGIVRYKGMVAAMLAFGFLEAAFTKLPFVLVKPLMAEMAGATPPAGQPTGAPGGQPVEPALSDRLTDEFNGWFRGFADDLMRALGIAFEHPGMNVVLACGIVAVLCGAFGAVTIYFVQTVSRLFAVRIVADLRGELARCFLGLPVRFFGRQRMGELISKVTNDTQVMQRSFELASDNVVVDPLMILGNVVVLAWFVPQALIVLALMVPAMAIPMLRQGRQVSKRSTRSLQAMGETTESLNQILTGIRTVKAFQLEGAMLRDFEASTGTFLDRTRKMLRAKGRSMAQTFVSYQVGFGVLLVLLGWVVLVDGAIHFDDVALVIMPLATTYQHVKRLTRSYHVLMESSGALAGLEAIRAQVAQQAASTAASRSYVLRAPVAGRVTALTARLGQGVSPQSQLMAIVPSGARLTAELAVPSAAMGFVKPGQEVRLALDAFPYQRFGTVKGRVRTVPSSTINAPASNGATIAVYPVIVDIEAPKIFAYGRDEPLVAGMNLTARIITERQSLLEWLFEPLFAVRRR